jgi:hypothetical protein
MNGWALASAIGLARYSRRGFLQIAGCTTIEKAQYAQKYLVLENRTKRNVVSRQYGPSHEVQRFLQSLNGVNYVVLRSMDEIEANKFDGDVDVLISAGDANKFAEALRRNIGTRPFDIYTSAGEFGFTYHGVPCFKPSLAEKILENAELHSSGIRVPSPKWRYLAFCYHVLFHDKLVPSTATQDKLEPASFRKPKHFSALVDLSRQAGFPQPRQIGELEAALRSEGAFPGLDLIGFYALRSEFAKRRYLLAKSFPPGLGVFFLRDFGSGTDLVEPVREMLAENFSIVVEGPVTDANRAEVLGNVRGGNWVDSGAPNGFAPPVYWFVCWDSSPKKPSLRMRWKYPNLDNSRLRLKSTIRAKLGKADTRHSPQVIVHSSDNTAEAIEHIRHLGVAEHPAIKSLGLEARS